MKTILFTLFLSYCFVSFSQNYKDIIITKELDSISCEITLVNDQSIFYNYLSKKKTKSSYIEITKVLSYFRNGESSEPQPVVIVDVKPKPINTTSYEPEGLSSLKRKQLVGGSLLIVGTGLLAFAVKEGKDKIFYMGLASQVIGFTINIESIMSSNLSIRK